MEIKSLVVDKESKELVVNLFFDQNAVGESMTLSVHQHVNVNVSGGVNKSKRVYREAFKVFSAGALTRRIPTEDIGAYTYEGNDISMSTEVQVAKSESILKFLNKQSRSVKLGFFRAPNDKASAQVMIEPPDQFDLFKNIQVLSGSDRLYFFFVCTLAVLAIGANTLLGWHDQSAPVGSTYFYSHYNSDGEKQSPMFTAMMVNSGLAASFGFWMKMILRRYMSFRLVGRLGKVSLGKRYSLRRLLSGESRIALQNCDLMPFMKT